MICSSWFAIGAPAKIAPAVVATLSDAVDRIKKQPALAARLAQLGLEPYSMSPVEAKEFIGRELERWRGLVATAGIKIE